MSKIYGVVPGKVTSDPDDMGRVRVRLEYLGGENETYPAPIATLMTGPDRGSWIMPEIGDDVLCAFEQGNKEKPYVVGFLWNGQHRAPETDKSKRLLRSVKGHEITIYDADGTDVMIGDGYIRISVASGSFLEIGNHTITLHCTGRLNLEAPIVTVNNRVAMTVPSTF
jgi:phage baseplate assembly protein gpV